LENETGLDAGLGTTLNVPLSAGATDDEYISCFNEKLIPAISSFKPDFVLVSAGFDAHVNDPLAGMMLTEIGYRELSKIIVDFSREYCAGRLVSLLEGGYNLAALANSVEAHINCLIE
jgi:acetoin utilization deacetylase AcuC-like enzyme